MKRFFVNITFFVAAMLSASIYEPLWAMEDSTQTTTKRTQTDFLLWQITYKSIPNRFETEFAQKILQDFKGDISTPVYPSFAISFVNFMWTRDDWITNFNYTSATRSTSNPSMSFECNVHEGSLGIGYLVVNTPRFRLYPTLAVNFVFDYVTITRQTSLSTLVSTFESPSISMHRLLVHNEIGVGADYRFPTGFGDLYIMGKIGYNLIIPGLHGYTWRHGARILNDADPEWLLRRGVFFQLGIGIGTERQ